MNIKSEKTLNLLSKIIFIIYIGLIVWVIMFKCNLIDSLNMTYEYLKDMNIKERFLIFSTPFKNYFPESINAPKYIFAEDDLLNIIIFIPIGLYLSYFIKNKKFIKVSLITFGISLFFELFQLFTIIGSFTLQDLMTNVIGGIIGYLVYKLLFIKKVSKLRTIILNVLSIVVIIVFVPILLYGIINTIKHFDFYIDILTRRL